LTASSRYGKSFTPTLHNGFLQSLLDSGFLGASLYLTIIWFVIWVLLKQDTARQYGAELYVLIFMTLSNFGETVIFSAAMYPGVLYWYVAVFALSLKRSKDFSTAFSLPKQKNRINYHQIKSVTIHTASTTPSFSSYSKGRQSL